MAMSQVSSTLQNTRIRITRSVSNKLIVLTAFNTANSLTWTADDLLQQGIYALFISTLNRNSSESPFFTIISTTVTSLVPSATTTVSASAYPPSSSLSEAAKVGIGLGIPFGLTLVICAAYFIWSKRFRQPGIGATPSGYGGSSAVVTQEQRQPVELGSRTRLGNHSIQFN